MGDELCGRSWFRRSFPVGCHEEETRRAVAGGVVERIAGGQEIVAVWGDVPNEIEAFREGKGGGREGMVDSVAVFGHFVDIFHC
jgi:hypothetical protein